MNTAQSTTTATLFRNVRVFDGISDTLSAAGDVLVRGNTIAAVGDHAAGDVQGSETVTVIDGAGHTLMPGLIDAHYHLAMSTVPMFQMMTADVDYVTIRGTQAARETLLRGFTTIRDVGGPTFGLKRAIDEGVIEGPRIYPSGAMISQTSGHGDFRMRYELPRGVCNHHSHSEVAGATAIADGPDEVLRATREQLMRGATQIKVMAGGGVASAYDPLDVTEYTEAELRAAVEAAENWGTYVTVHAYTDRAVQQAIRAGMRCVEHGQLLTEETVEMMAEHDIRWSLQPFGVSAEQSAMLTPDQKARFLQVAEGTERTFGFVEKYGIKSAWGTDILFDAAATAQQGAMLAATGRWQSAGTVLRTATSGNAETVAMCGPRNPYPGELGVIRPGALADLLLVRGNPVENLNLLATPETSLSVIMKDGKIHKNLLGERCTTSERNGAADRAARVSAGGNRVRVAGGGA
ncbi:amidohydrolase family protein [Nocardia sp. NPDC057030]|uniref:metal-dependent hydrolase family protein n=1 Tax=unclassified Nocardia TaxID=2637762 RepID=UPI00362E9E86